MHDVPMTVLVLVRVLVLVNVPVRVHVAVLLRMIAFVRHVTVPPGSIGFRPLQAPSQHRSHQNRKVPVTRSVRGSTGWKWMSATGCVSPGSCDS